MIGPRLLTTAELADIRRRAEADKGFAYRGWTNKCMADRQALLAHVLALHEAISRAHNKVNDARGAGSPRGPEDPTLAASPDDRAAGASGSRD